MMLQIRCCCCYYYCCCSEWKERGEEEGNILYRIEEKIGRGDKRGERGRLIPFGIGIGIGIGIGLVVVVVVVVVSNRVVANNQRDNQEENQYWSKVFAFP